MSLSTTELETQVPAWMTAPGTPTSPTAPSTHPTVDAASPGPTGTPDRREGEPSAVSSSGAGDTPSATGTPTTTGMPSTKPQAFDFYSNYGQDGVTGFAVCRGNSDRPESWPGGQVTQSFTVAKTGTITSVLAQVDPDSTVTAHAALLVNGATKATSDQLAAGDTRFAFGPVPVHAGDTVTFQVAFTATYGKIISMYYSAQQPGTLSVSNSCRDGAGTFSVGNGLRAVVSGTA